MKKKSVSRRSKEFLSVAVESYVTALMYPKLAERILDEAIQSGATDFVYECPLLSPKQITFLIENTNDVDCLYTILENPAYDKYEKLGQVMSHKDLMVKIKSNKPVHVKTALILTETKAEKEAREKR